MLIRDWKFEDILRISEMEKECFGKESWSYKVLADCYENPAFYGLVAEEDGEIIGYGGITVAADTSDLENVMVAEEYRRSGVGKRIVEHLLCKAKEKGAEKSFLEVRVSNTAALKLYLNCGFVGAYARTRYYADGEDCLVMQKTII